MIPPRKYLEQDLNPDRLVEEHLEMVKRIAWYYQGRVGRFAEIEDLIQAGYLGLVDAAQKYSVRDGVKFSAYATIRIRGAIVDYLRRNSNLCRSTISMRQKIEKTRADLEAQLKRAPDHEEVADAMKIPVEELYDWQARFQVNQLKSLDEIYTDHSLLFSDVSGNAEDAMQLSQMKKLLKDAIEALPKREAMVLQLYFVEELNVYEIAEALEVTTGRVSQIKKAAIIRLRDMMREHLSLDA